MSTALTTPPTGGDRHARPTSDREDFCEHLRRPAASGRGSGGGCGRSTRFGGERARSCRATVLGEGGDARGSHRHRPQTRRRCPVRAAEHRGVGRPRPQGARQGDLQGPAVRGPGLLHPELRDPCHHRGARRGFAGAGRRSVGRLAHQRHLPGLDGRFAQLDVRCRPRRGAEGTTGHAVRAQFDRRCGEHHHAAAGQGVRDRCERGDRQRQPAPVRGRAGRALGR